MNKFKNVVNGNSTDKIAETVELIEGQWNTLSQIQARADLLDASVRASILSDTNIMKNTYNMDTLKEIYSLRLPAYMAWDYWVAINQWCTYWVNRNEITCDDDKVKQSFKLALKMGRMYGTCAIMKKDENYIVGSLTEQQYKEGELVGGTLIPSYISNRYGYASVSPDDKLIKWDEKATAKGIKVTKDNCLFFACRDNGVGDFVWSMKFILIEIYLKTMIQSNASNLYDKMFMKVNNPATMPFELALARNPFIPYAVVIEDSQSGVGTNEFKFSESAGGQKTNISSLIECLKHHQEYYYSMLGRPISSNKAQALSSDSSLSISSAEAIANDWDDRVEILSKQWNEKFNTSISVEKPELDTPPQNQNADKGGLGTALTDAQKVRDEAQGAE